MKQEKKGTVSFFSLPWRIVLENEKQTKKRQLRRLLVKKKIIIIIIIHHTYALGLMYVEKPTDPGESLLALSNLFFLTWNFSVNFNLKVFRSL